MIPQDSSARLSANEPNQNCIGLPAGGVLHGQRYGMKRLAEVLVVLGAMILTDGGGYVVVLGHVARANRDYGLVAVAIEMLGAGVFTIGLLMLRDQKSRPR